MIDLAHDEGKSLFPTYMKLTVLLHDKVAIYSVSTL